MDSKIVQVALNGLENILRLGEQDAKMQGGNNPYAVMIEACFGEKTICLFGHLDFAFCSNFIPSETLNSLWFTELDTKRTFECFVTC